MTDAPLIRGHCLCGAVAFTLQAPLDFVAHCHCASCRLSHGAAFVTWTSVPHDRFLLSQGDLGWYRSSSCIEWGFCRTCGSSMLYRAIAEGHHESPRIDRMYVTAASLIDPLDREPSVHVSYEEHVSWLDLHDTLPKRMGKTDRLVE